MYLVLDLIIGTFVGALEGGSVFFAREEPYKIEITLAAALKGLLTGLLTGFSPSSRSLVESSRLRRAIRTGSGTRRVPGERRFSK